MPTTTPPTGQLIIPNHPATGRIHNLSATANPSGDATIRCTTDPPNPNHTDLAILLDGAVAHRVPSTAQPADLPSLPDGDHNLRVITLPAHAPTPDLRGDLDASRACVRWPRSTDPDLAGYRILWDAGNPAAPVTTTLAFVAAPAITRLDRARPTTGTGLGRVTIAGAYAGPQPAPNIAITLTITAPGIATVALAGVASQPIPFTAGSRIPLGYGASATFHDDPEDYDTGDTFSTHLGPPTEYLSPPLEPGTYRFTVLAVDHAGNASPPIATPRAVRIVATPPPASVAIAWHPDTEHLSLTVAHADYDDVAVYTNWIPSLATLGPHVLLDAPAAVLLPAEPAGFDVWTFTPAPGLRGRLLVYVRPRKDAIEREDLTLHAINFPPTPQDLNEHLAEPTALTASPAPGGDITAAWAYRPEPLHLDDLSHFLLWIWDDPSAVDWTDTPLATITLDQATGYPVRRFSILLDLNLPTGTQRTIGVRAVSTNGTHSTTTATATVTTDATPPTLTGPLTGSPA